MAHTEYGLSCARLHSLFDVQFQGHQLQLALLHWFKAASKPHADNKIGMQRVRSLPAPEIIEVDSFVRGCHLISSHDTQPGTDYYIDDMVDPDMYLRVNKTL